MQSSLVLEDLDVLAEDATYAERFRRLLQGDLDFHGKNSTYGNHSWHAFPAKFPPQLPRVFIRELTKPGEVVFDPMMGSCTALLEAVRLNRKTVGCDIDPLTLRIGAAKLRPIKVEHAAGVGRRVVEGARNSLANHREWLESKLHERTDEPTRAFIEYWFAKTTQIELMALLHEIDLLDDLSLREFFKLVFSAIIITKSGGVSLARDLAHTRPHKVDKIPNSALDEFQKRLQRNLQSYQPQPGITFRICEADAQNLPIADNSVALIVTSPPYVSHAIDYMRAHKFSLAWLGHSVDDLSSLRRKYIGGDAISKLRMESMPEYTRSIIQRLENLDKKKSLSLHRYCSEMTLVLKEMYRVLKPGRAAVLVVGTSVLRGVNVETQNCLGEIGRGVGFDLVHIGVRRLDRDKRMMPARWHENNGTTIEARMHEEYVIGFLKPETTRCE